MKLLGGEPAQPLTTIEVGRYCNVAPCSRLDVLISAFDSSASDLVRFEKMEDPTARELPSICRSLKINFPVNRKVAKNLSWGLGRCDPTKLFCPSVFWLADEFRTATIKHATANHVDLTRVLELFLNGSPIL